MRGKKSKGIQVLAWSSYALAVIGGAALVVSPVGGILAAVIGLFPTWVASTALIAGFAAMGADLYVDGTPNRPALVTAILLPSVARATPGKLGETVTHLCDQVLAQANAALGPLLGTTSALTVAAAATVGSALIARRVIVKAKPAAPVAVAGNPPIKP